MLDFHDADLHKVIRIIGEVADKPIIISDTVGPGGKVTLKLKDVPWDQALDIILSSQGLAVDDGGNVLTVYPLPVLEEILRSRADVEKSGLDINAVPPLAKKVFTPKYSPLSLVHEELKKHKSGRGKIVAIGNEIYVEDEPAAIAAMAQTYLRVDRPAPLILIEARIVETSAAFAEKIGFRRLDGVWGEDGTAMAGEAAQGRPGEAAGPEDLTAAPELEVVILNKDDSLLLNSAFFAQETSGETRTISAPRIKAANDQEISIKHGWQLGGDCRGMSATTACDPHFKMAVMEMNIKPHIEESGNVVALDIILTSYYSSDSRSAAAKLEIADGQTVAIGEVFADRDSGDESSVKHILSLADWLYINRPSSERAKSEILIFVTATIISINP